MRTTRTMIAMMAVLALALTACGGGDIEDADPAGAEADADAAAADPTDDAAPDDGDAVDDAATDDAAATDDDAAATDDDDDAADGGDGGAVSLLGAGASFPDPVYQEWIGEFTTDVAPDVSIQYESIGSGGGKEQLIGQQTAFAGTDSVMDDEEIAEAVEARGCGDVVHIPMVFGGVVVAYNIEGVDDLVLDGETIAGIFSGEITSADDEAIAALNPDVDLPAVALVPTVRADSSGTTEIFTTYLEDESEAWASEYGSGSEVDWFGGQVAGEQNDGVAAAIGQQPGAVGYLSLEYAEAAGLPYAAVENADGEAVAATTDSVAAATEGLDLPEDLRFDILGVGGEGYPIAGATWILAYTCGYDDAEATAIADFLTWGIEEGGDVASSLGYAPLSESTAELSLEKIAQINADDA